MDDRFRLDIPINRIVMSKITYIATPIGYLDEPHWRAVAVIPGGDTAIVIGIQIRDLAARIQRGGRLVLPNGSPMSIIMIAAALGREVAQVEFALGLLQQVGTVTRSGVVVTVTDPLLLDHFTRVGALMLTDKTERNRALSAQRSKNYRVRKKAERHGNVTLEPHNHHSKMRDEIPQVTEIVYINSSHDTTIQKNKRLKTTSPTKGAVAVFDLPGKVDTRDNRELILKLLAKGITDEIIISAEIERAIAKGLHPADYLHAALNALLAGHPGYAEAQVRKLLASNKREAAEKARKEADEELRRQAHTPEAEAAGRAALTEMMCLYQER